MPSTRIARALAVLLLIVAQVALAFPHRMMGGAGGSVAAAQEAGAHEGMGSDCHHSAPASAGQGEHQQSPMPCGSCPASLPGAGGACLDMASCGPIPVVAGTPPVAVLATIQVGERWAAVTAPPAHDFIPDPPPPRA